MVLVKSTWIVRKRNGYSGIGGDILMTHLIPRRDFLRDSLAIGAALATGSAARAFVAPGGNEICAFIKFVQSLSYDQLAEAIADTGFDGIEATVRRGGKIEPQKAVDELPKL